MTEAAMNTDREIWRAREGDAYADRIHVTKEGAIGIDCGGYVIVKPVRAWHALASAAPSPDGEEVERVAIIMFESAGINVRWTDPHVTEGRRHLWRAAARKAISAMRPAPKLTEEDRARVEEVREWVAELMPDTDVMYSGDADKLEDTRFLLSLIDKLTEAG